MSICISDLLGSVLGWLAITFIPALFIVLYYVAGRTQKRGLAAAGPVFLVLFLGSLATLSALVLEPAFRYYPTESRRFVYDWLPVLALGTVLFAVCLYVAERATVGRPGNWMAVASRAVFRYLLVISLLCLAVLVLLYFMCFHRQHFVYMH